LTTVVVAEFIAATALHQLEERTEVIYDPELGSDRKRLAGALAEAAALIVRNQTVVDDALLAGAPSLVTVGRLGAGLDNIDVAAVQRRGVVLHTAAGLNAATVAEYVIAAALLLTRRSFGATQAILDGAWPRRDLVGGEIAGRRIGIVGFGRAGREVAMRAAGLGMTCVAADPLLPPDHEGWALAEPVEVAAALASDVVTLHVPLTAATRHLVDAAAIELMPPGAVLINTSRGAVVDVPAVAAALRSGALGGAALDVLPEEPPSAEMLRVLDHAPNLVLTPHIAGVTAESNERISTHIATAVLREVT